nr:unnamed protein product [Digitaria exilis]
MASEDQVKETVSRSTTETATGVHTFEIIGLSLKKVIGAGRSFESGTFTIGGYKWMLRFSPDGLTKNSKTSWLHIILLTMNAVVPVWHEVRLVKRLSGKLGRGWISPSEQHQTLNTTGQSTGPQSISIKMDMSHEDLVTSGYIRDDRLTIRCELTVVKETTLSPTTLAAAELIDVPPPDIASHLGKLLEDKEGANVTFSVRGETILAHRVVLFMRSPVLKGRLLGPMRDKGTDMVMTIDDMQPEVFKALLHFIYTDSLPDLTDLEGDDYREMIMHLLVAADMYAMERLKMMCQRILAKNLDLETVATTLGLADQHNCQALKDICIELLNSSDPDEMDVVMKTQVYQNLKRSCPSVIIEVYERSRKRPKT